MSNNSENPGFLKGLLFGSVAGFLAGIVFAPEKGEDTRRKLLEKKKEWEPHLKDLSSVLKRGFDPFIKGFLETSGDSLSVISHKEPDTNSPEIVEESSQIAPPPPVSAPSQRHRFFKVKK